MLLFFKITYLKAMSIIATQVTSVDCLIVSLRLEIIDHGSEERGGIPQCGR
jgi:hypothetical protein